jgi:hypothetical protein
VPALTRSEFLAALAGAGVALVGCGSSSDPLASAQMVARFAPDSLLAGAQRVVVILGYQQQGSNAPTLLTSGPKTIQAGLFNMATNTKIADVSAPMYGQGLPSAYWPFDLRIDTPGSYELRAKIGGKQRTLAFTVGPRSGAHIPTVGDSMPSIDSPTIANTRGVNPICTNQPRCPFHAVSLADALTAKSRVLFYVGTPAYCQTGVCGPGLQFLIDSQTSIAKDVVVIHAEVYIDDTLKTTTAAVDTLGLTFEPCLFLVGGDGIISQRIDSVFAAADLRGVLSSAGFLAA